MNNNFTNISIEESDIETLTTEFGPFIFHETKRLNESFFANLYLKYEKCLFDFGEKVFYIYDPETGLWKEHEAESVMRHVDSATRSFLKSQDASGLFFAITRQFIRNCLIVLKGIVGKKDPFAKAREKIKVHCSNCVLEVSPDNQRLIQRSFSSDDLSRSRTEIPYNAEANSPSRFLNELLKPVLSQGEIDVLQMYMGQCLLGVNISQQLLFITGAGGSGKSTLVDIIRGLIGNHNTTELRTEHLKKRFEAGRYVGHSLLLGSEADEEFFNTKGFGVLKKLTGRDNMTGEKKLSNKKIDFQGIFNIIIVANSLSSIHMENDADAWRRRLLWIRFQKKQNENFIENFAQKLLLEEGAEIFKWALDGALKLYQNGKKIKAPESMVDQINYLLSDDDPVQMFVQQCMTGAAKSSVSVNELVEGFESFRIQHELEKINEIDFLKRVRIAIYQILQIKRSNSITRNGKWVRGYRNAKLAVS